MITRTSLADETTPDIGDYISYDPLTGVLACIKPRQRCKVGDTLGTLSADGYLRLTFKGKSYLCHRLAVRLMTGFWPNGVVDHRDLCRSNNKWANLRQASQSENCANSPLTVRNQSGFKGVYFHKKTRRFQAYIGRNGGQRHLGYFESAEEAHSAYVKAAELQYGEFARSA